MEFNLRTEREKLYKLFHESAMDCDSLIEEIEKQDNEFIRLLLNTDWDVEPCCHGINQKDFIERVNSLVGDELREKKE